MRRHPYKDVTRAKCFKCGAPGYAEWRICADGIYRVTCAKHDMELNILAAQWAFPPKQAAHMIETYKEKQRLAHG